MRSSSPFIARLKAYGDYHDKYSRMLEGEVGERAAGLVEPLPAVR